MYINFTCLPCRLCDLRLGWAVAQRAEMPHAAAWPAFWFLRFIRLMILCYPDAAHNARVSAVLSNAFIIHDVAVGRRANVKTSHKLRYPARHSRCRWPRRFSRCLPGQLLLLHRELGDLRSAQRLRHVTVTQRCSTAAHLFPANMIKPAGVALPFGEQLAVLPCHEERCDEET